MKNKYDYKNELHFRVYDMYNWVSYLLAVHTLHGKLLLIAGHTEVMVVLRDEALGANGLLASLAGETGLMPTVPLVLHLSGAFRETESKGMNGVSKRMQREQQ